MQVCRFQMKRLGVIRLAYQESEVDQNSEVRREIGLSENAELLTPIGHENFKIIRTGIYATEPEREQGFWELAPVC